MRRFAILFGIAAIAAAAWFYGRKPDLPVVPFAKVMRELGVWEPLADRLRPAPNGAMAMKALAASKSARPIGCTQATEILSTPGIVVVAPLPPGCALATTYTCAITGHAAAPDQAASLIALLTSDTDRNARRQLGFS